MTVNHPDQFDGGASAFFPERLMNGRYVQPGGPLGIVISDQFIVARSFQPGFPCQPQQLQSDSIACAEYAAAGIPVQEIKCCIQIRIGGSRPAVLFQLLPESVPAQSTERLVITDQTRTQTPERRAAGLQQQIRGGTSASLFIQRDGYSATVQSLSRSSLPPSLQYCVSRC